MSPEAQVAADFAVLALGAGLTGISAARRSFDFAHRCGLVYVFAVAALWTARFWSAGHLPIFGAYESALSLIFFAGLVAVIAARASRQPLLWIFPPAAALMLLHGTRYSREVWALTISERGFWVHLHAVLAFLAFGFAICLLSSAILVLMGRQAPLQKILLAFVILYALNIVTGSIYRFLLFGTAWSFDPIEAMNLACFLAFITLIHMLSFRRLDLKKAARWSILCVVILVLAYRLVLVFPTWSSYHILDIELRTHIQPG